MDEPNPERPTEDLSLLNAAQVKTKSTTAPRPDYGKAEPQPFTEWISLFAITLVLSVLVFAIRLYFDIQFIDSSAYFYLSDQDTGLPILAPLMHIEVLLKAGELLTAICLLFLLAGKCRLFLKVVRIFLFVGLIYQVIEFAAGIYLRSDLIAIGVGEAGTTSLTPEFQLNVVLLVAPVSILLRIIWLTYFSTAEQVKKIFIN
ncbi:MAG TPA: hypothetical protein VLL54_06895 [Pyrinomonadaceae bacterium]|nr:hypothetical protein [Pyrinomonadaceae bacterium]